MRISRLGIQTGFRSRSSRPSRPPQDYREEEGKAEHLAVDLGDGEAAEMAQLAQEICGGVFALFGAWGPFRPDIGLCFVWRSLALPRAVLLWNPEF